MTEQEFAELAAGFALNALSSEDEAAYRSALAAHPEWAASADADAQTVAFLADTVPEIAPQASTRAALLARIAVPDAGRAAAAPDAGRTATATTATSAGDRALRDMPPHRRWSRAIFALAASFVVVLGLGFAVLQMAGVFAPPASVQALENIQAAVDAQEASVPVEGGGEATAHWSSSLGQAVLVVDGVATLPASSEYELWFVRGDEALSAGTFAAADGGATAVLAGQYHAGDAIAVTVEDAGGSLTGVPTTTPIAVIPTA